MQQYNPIFYTFYIFPGSDTHPTQGKGSLTCHVTQFEWSDWLRSANFINIMIEWKINIGSVKLDTINQ